MDREHMPPLVRQRTMAASDRLLDIELTLYGQDGRSGIIGLVRETALKQSDYRKERRLRHVKCQSWAFRAALVSLVLVTLALVAGKQAVIDGLILVLKAAL